MQEIILDNPEPPAPPPRVVMYPQLQTIYGLPYSRMQIDRLEHAGGFPKRVQISRGRVAWLAHEIEAWITSRPRRAAPARRGANPHRGAAA